MKYYCEDCELKIPSHEEWSIHLVSPTHQENVENKIVEWVNQQTKECLVFICNGSIRSNLLGIIAKLLSYGFMANLSINLIEDDQMLLVVQYDTGETAGKALGSLKNEPEWSAHKIRQLVDVPIEEWRDFFPNLKFVEKEKVVQTDGNMEGRNNVEKNAAAKENDNDDDDSPSFEELERMLLKIKKEKLEQFGDDFRDDFPEVENPLPVIPPLNVIPEIKKANANDNQTNQNIQIRGTVTANVNNGNYNHEDRQRPSTSSAFAKIQIGNGRGRCTDRAKVETRRRNTRKRASSSSSSSSSTSSAGTGNRRSPSCSRDRSRSRTRKGKVSNKSASKSKSRSRRPRSPIKTKTRSRSRTPPPRKRYLSRTRTRSPSQNNVIARKRFRRSYSRSRSNSRSPHPSQSFFGQRYVTSKNVMMLDQQFHEFYKTKALDLVDLAKIQERIVDDLKTILRKTFPNCELYLIDSLLTKKTSVVEINIDKLEVKEKEKLEHYPDESKFSYEARLNMQRVSKIASILRNKIRKFPELSRPIDKIHEVLDGFLSRINCTIPSMPKYQLHITACVSRQQLTRKQDFQLMDFYIQINPRIRPLFCFLQQWAEHNSFIHLQSIKDYVIPLMVILFLMRQRLIPNLRMVRKYASKYMDNTDDPEWLTILFEEDKKIMRTGLTKLLATKFIPPVESPSLITLVREFFTTFGNKHMQNMVLYAYTAEFAQKKIFTSRPSQIPYKFQEYKDFITKTAASYLRAHDTILSIQDPFDLSFNLGSTIPEHVAIKFQNECIKSLVIINSMLKELNSTKVNLTANLFGGPVIPLCTRSLVPYRVPQHRRRHQFRSRSSSFSPSRSPSPVFLRRPRPPLAIGTAEDKRNGYDVNLCQSIPIPERFDELINRFTTRLRKMNIIPPIHGSEARTKYSYFYIDKTFRQAFEAHMNRECLNRNELLHYKLQTKLTRLWSTFALHFIRTIWDECFGIDMKEDRIIEELLLLDGNGGNKDKDGQEVLEEDLTFPIGYSTIYSFMDCKGYIGEKVAERLKLRDTLNKNRINSEIPPLSKHPFDEEATVTKLSKTIATNKQNGKVTWKFECEFLYEDDKFPKILIILNGSGENQEEIDILHYLTTVIRKTFNSYLMHLLKIWFNNKQDLVQRKVTQRSSTGLLEAEAETDEEAEGNESPPTNCYSLLPSLITGLPITPKTPSSDCTSSNVPSSALATTETETSPSQIQPTPIKPKPMSTKDIIKAANQRTNQIFNEFLKSKTAITPDFDLPRPSSSANSSTRGAFKNTFVDVPDTAEKIYTNGNTTPTTETGIAGQSASNPTAFNCYDRDSDSRNRALGPTSTSSVIP